jgi:endonuclease/exonuclease/phosphatase family metal-dependent hydrolase
LLRTNPEARFVVCGDFNDTIDSDPLKTILGSGPAALTPFVRELPPDTITYNLPPHLSMIDFILASPAMARDYVPRSYQVITGGSPSLTGSDHNPVVARFRLERREQKTADRRR